MAKGGNEKSGMDRATMRNRANQLNPNNAAYRSSRGLPMGSKGGDEHPTPNDQRSNVLNPNNPARKDANDNHSNQLNPNNAAHQSCREGQLSDITYDDDDDYYW